MSERTRRIQLPSGAVIEFIVGTVMEMHRCIRCPGEMVVPTEWEERDEGWYMALRCPDCEARWDGVYPELDIAVYDEHLYDTTIKTAEALDILAGANFSCFINRFVEALNNDDILPEDF